jgi:Glu-tRNA(Gln) amidotransferase subunit E-like FAD-binding protein
MKRVSKEGVLPLLERAVGEEKSVAELMPEPFDKGAFEKRLAGIAADVKGRRFADAEGRWRYVMGLVMKDWRGRVEGRTAAEDVRRRLERVTA